MCLALSLLRVSRSLVVKIAGEARMERAMQAHLEQGLALEKVTIQPPVKANGEYSNETEAA